MATVVEPCWHDLGGPEYRGVMVVDVQDVEFFNWWSHVRFPEWRTELRTWIAKNPEGGGGLHVYFKHDSAYNGKCGSKVIFSPVTKGPVGVALLIGNVQDLAYPARIDGGGGYNWLDGRSPEDTPLADIAGSGFDELFEEYHVSRFASAVSLVATAE